MKKTSYLLVILLSFVVFSVVVATTTTLYNVKGYSWSSNVGWVKADPTNGGVFMSNDGTLSGYAWANPYDSRDGSKNLGWLSFKASDISGCPSGPGTCPATVTSTTTNSTVTGWARFIAHDVLPNTYYTGWVHLSGTATNGSPYGVTYDASAKTLNGYAWGGNVVGWIHISFSIEGTCELATAPAAPTGLQASAASCNEVDLSWIAPPATNPPVSGYYIYRNGQLVFSSISPSAIDTTVIPGQNYSYRVSAYIGGACQFVEGGQSSLVNVNTPNSCNTGQPALSLKCFPTNVIKGASATLNWTASSGGSCTITGTDPKFSPVTFSVDDKGGSGSVPTGPITQTRDYNMTCTGAKGAESVSTKGTCYVSAEYQHF